ncbi:MAG: hypothetical protein Q4Q04_06415 [Methanocorpusculum sp.]|nr:hypothetical protein [Methanocorpusculum sp.]
MKRLEQMIEERFDDTISKVQDIKESNTILRERIGFLESTYSAVTCAVAETRPEYKKR